MVVNSDKTTLVCMSDAQQYEADAYINDEDGVRIGCTKGSKALGMRFSNKLNMNEQVRAMQKTVRSRLWTLRNLKGHGFNQEELLTVYKTIIRPALEYGAAVYHSSLTDEQDEALERLQVQALKTIFDPYLSGRRLREIADIDTLRSRREQISLKFALKCSVNARLSHLFPIREHTRSTRSAGTAAFLETKARCERLRNSPLHYFRRVLNGKVGKIYGKRYAEYRDK